MRQDLDVAALAHAREGTKIRAILRVPGGYRAAVLDQDYLGQRALVVRGPGALPRDEQTRTGTLRDLVESTLADLYEGGARGFEPLVPAPREADEIRFFASPSVRSVLADYAWASESAAMPEKPGEPGEGQGGLVYRDPGTGLLDRADRRPARRVERAWAEGGGWRRSAVDWHCRDGRETARVEVGEGEDPASGMRWQDRKTFRFGVLYAHARESFAIDGAGHGRVLESFERLFDAHGFLASERDTRWKHAAFGGLVRPRAAEDPGTPAALPVPAP